MANRDSLGGTATERVAGPIDVAIVDKSPLVRMGLTRLLADDERFRPVFSATDGKRLLDALAQRPADVVVLGWVMPFCDGRCVLESFRQMADPPKAVVYTGSPESGLPELALRLGAAGYCRKSEEPEVLLDVVASVALGRMVFPFVDLGRGAGDPLSELTPRELELLRELGNGSTNAKLAKQLGVSVNTVKFHLANVYRKLDVRNRAQAVALLLRHDSQS